MESRRTVIFISYARSDFYLAERVYAELLSAGTDPWFDMDRLGPNDEWKPALERAIAGADVVAVIASRRSMSPGRKGAKPSFVQDEIRYAQCKGTPIRVLRADGAALVSELSCVQVYDTRPSVSRAVSDLCKQLAVPGGRERIGSTRLPIWPVPLMVVLGLAFAALTSLGAAGWQLRHLATSFLDHRAVTELGAAPVGSRTRTVVIAGFFVGAALILLCCAAALVRRRWQTKFVLPLLAPAAILLGLAVLLPSSSQLRARYPGSGTGSLVAEASMLRPALYLAAVAVLLALVTTLASVDVLSSSLTQRGSQLARVRVVRRGRPEGGWLWAAFVVFDHAGMFIGGVNIRQALEKMVDCHADPPPTYRIAAAPQDRGLADELRTALDNNRLRETPGDKSSRLFVILSNLNTDHLVSDDPDGVNSGVTGPDVMVLGTSTNIDDNSPLLRNQLVDFRALALNNDILIRLAGGSLPAEFRWFSTPVAPRASKVPAQLFMGLFSLLFSAFWLVLTAGSDLYWLLCGRPVNVIRLILVLASLVAVLRTVAAAAGRRRTVSQLKPAARTAAATVAAYAVATALDSQIFVVMRLAGVLVPAWLIWQLLTLTKEFGSWLPSAPLDPVSPNGARLSWVSWQMLASPYLYAVLMVLPIPVIFRPF